MGDGALPLPGHYWRCPNQYDSHTYIMPCVLCIGVKSAVKSRTKSRDIYATTLYQSEGCSVETSTIRHEYCEEQYTRLCAVVIMFYRDKRLPICIPQMHGNTYERAVGEARAHVRPNSGRMKAMSAVCTYYRKGAS